MQLSAGATRFSLAATCLLGATAWFSACSQASRLNVKCLAGEAAVCAELGDMYANGRGVARDLGQASQAYQRACDGGAADVCNTLGEIVERSGGVEGGTPRAERYYQQACDGGSSPGCLNLGLVAAGREEKERAFALYERSCNGGWAPGCHQMAASYEQGEGVAVDIAKAVAHYSEACDGEYVEGCTAAANLYVAGEVITKDVATALKYYGKAFQIYSEGCQAGIQAECTERDRLRNTMAILATGQAAAPPARSGDGVR